MNTHDRLVCICDACRAVRLKNCAKLVELRRVWRFVEATLGEYHSARQIHEDLIEPIVDWFWDECRKLLFLGGNTSDNVTDLIGGVLENRQPMAIWILNAFVSGHLAADENGLLNLAFFDEWQRIDGISCEVTSEEEQVEIKRSLDGDCPGLEHAHLLGMAAVLADIAG